MTALYFWLIVSAFATLFVIYHLYKYFKQKAKEAANDISKLAKIIRNTTPEERMAAYLNNKDRNEKN